MEYRFLYYDALLSDASEPSRMVAVYEVLDDYDRIHEHVIIPADSTDVVADILAALPPALTSKVTALTSATNIPNWAHWTESEAETWWSTNIDDPIDNGITNLPNPITSFTQVRAILLQMLTVMQYMSTMLWALARMVIALRNNTWPQLEN